MYKLQTSHSIKSSALIFEQKFRPRRRAGRVVDVKVSIYHTDTQIPIRISPRLPITQNIISVNISHAAHCKVVINNRKHSSNRICSQLKQKSFDSSKRTGLGQENRYKNLYHILSEIWLNTSTTNAEVEIQESKIYSLDRKHKKGGGVCIYVRNDFRTKVLKDLS